MKKIIITVSKKGEVSVKTDGYSGDACLLASSPYEKTLGKIASCEPTGEYYEEGQDEKIEIKDQ